MKTKQVSITTVILLCSAMAVLAGGVGYWLHESKKSAPAPEPEPATARVEVAAPAPAPAPEPEMTDEDWDSLIAEIEEEPASGMPDIDMEDLEERRARWENMSMEQRRMMRKAMFAALSKVEGLEEVGEAMRQGKIDPRSFSMDPTAIADRLEFHADTMDQEAMEAEVTATLQDLVDQARAQMR
jgi:uncharacterized membrane protein